MNKGAAIVTSIVKKTPWKLDDKILEAVKKEINKDAE